MYDEIKEQFREVIAFSQGIPDPKVDILFEHWAEAKEKFIKRFGGLIYEWPEPITFCLDEKDKIARARDFSSTIYDSFSNYELAKFIDDNIETFFDNIVSNSDKKEIPKGMKLVKAFKYFEKDKSVLTEMQNMASQYIQENCMSGTLCFSVHPLDFLSSSENTYNWRSCHALDGEYRAGNLSYMVDETTFMVYLKGADDVILPAFPSTVKWNSKKWRMLIHAAIDDELIFAGRQYPFASKPGIDTVLNIYNNLVLKDKNDGELFWDFGQKYEGWCADYVDSYVPFDAKDNTYSSYLSTRYLIYNNRLLDIEKAMIDGHCALNYNDVLGSTCYKYPYYAILDRWSYKKDFTNPIVVGAAVDCLHCGEDIIDNPETMRCHDCEMEFGTEINEIYDTCSCCGTRIYVEDAAMVGEELVCDYCLANRTFTCDECGELFFTTDKYVVPGDENGDHARWLCNYCYHDYLNEEEN